ncbi:MAG TPA: transporter [Methyloceanibacter sp.]|nr:transporter [Methyloceanibacter sp.]
MSSFSLGVFRSGACILCLSTALAALSAKADPHSGNALLLADQHAPAGVLFDHMHKAGEIMLGFRYAGSFAGGSMLNGENSVNDQKVIDEGCTPHVCAMKPTDMTMHMYMLDIMYAPADWLTLMVMPMWMSHDMTMKPLKGVMPNGHDDHDGMDHGGHMGAHSHSTEGWGDTVFGPEIRLAEGPGYHLHVSPMLSAPTGRVDYKTAGVFTHYGMQPGSGTWDFVPSITYTGRAARWTWGAQVLGVMRLEEDNRSGYRLGDIFQATAWGSYRFADWISASLRGLYTEQGKIEGHYNAVHNHSSPPDLQFNYGGRFWDIGFGLNTVVTGGALRGLRLSAEWLQPVMDDPNGYQLEREGTLWANATMSF